jgi:hypothetical protein
MGMRLVGSLNLGFALIALNYVLSWVLAIVYGRVAAGKFDPLSAKAASEITGHRKTASHWPATGAAPRPSWGSPASPRFTAWTARSMRSAHWWLFARCCS